TRAAMIWMRGRREGGAARRLLSVFLAYRRHVYRGVSHAVETQKVVDFAIVVPAEINRSQAQGVGHKIDILGDVTRLQEDKAVAPVAVLKTDLSKTAVMKITKAAPSAISDWIIA